MSLDHTKASDNDPASAKEAAPPSVSSQNTSSPERKNSAGKRSHTWLEKLTLFIAVLAFGVASRQAWVASDNEYKTLRAYVLVTDVRFAKDEADGKYKFGRSFENGTHELLIYYDVVNEGRTPAHDLEKAVDVEYPWKGHVKFDYTDGTPGYLPQRHTFGPVRTRPFTDEEIQKIATGDPPFVFAGQIWYHDIFDHRWPTFFCFMYAKRPIEPSFDFCPRWSADDRLNYAR